MSVAVTLEDLYDALADGDLDGKGSYAKKGAGASTFDVNPATPLEGAKSISLTDGAAGAVAYEKAIGATLALTARWRFTWKARVATGAAAANESFISLTKGVCTAGDPSTAAIRMAMLRNGTTVDMKIGDGGGTQDLAGAFALDSIPWLKLDLLPGGAYALAKSTDAGSTWSQLTSGNLVVANRAIDYFHFGNDGVSPHVSATHWYDTLRFLVLTADVKADLGTRPEREAVLTGATVSGGLVTLTFNILDLNTGAAVATGRTTTMPVADLEPSPVKTYQQKIDEALEADLRAYDLTARVALLNASGHERTH